MTIDYARLAQNARSERIGVIDIGSNSVRMVVYDQLSRAPLPVFNEKALCGLGRSLQETGKLHPEGVTLALESLARFRELAQAMQLRDLYVLATAAVRDASDGAQFVDWVKAKCHLSVRVISGEEEARLSALGVLSGTPSADGVMGDLGGGSLELVGINRRELCEQHTTPLGPLRLMSAGMDLARQQAHVEQYLLQMPWLQNYQGRSFYPVGGAWRSLAKIYIERVGHPVHIVHDFEVEAGHIKTLAQEIMRLRPERLEKDKIINMATKKRRETLPIAAMILERLLSFIQPAQVVFSAFGLREGLIFDLLPPQERAQDPLIQACIGLEHRLGRFGQGDILAQWTASLFAHEGEKQYRLRHAACLLSDLGWFEHPDYRAEHAYQRILRMPFAAISHSERVILALAVYGRYGGDFQHHLVQAGRQLVSDKDVAHAALLGQALRLAHSLTGGASGLLARSSLRLGTARLTLLLPTEYRVLAGEASLRRLAPLAQALGRLPAIETTPQKSL
jgi:exopolyphosphatase / guanosine-5'-triphosphate,3'-diphosphate pyrophosphatase